MDGYIMTDRYIIADFHHRAFVEGMKHASVLDVYSVTNADRVHVATKNGIEPNAAIFPDGYIAYDGSVFGQVSVFSNLRSETSD